MILVDEVQEIDVGTLGSVGPVIQDLQRQRDLTVMIVFSGLPDAPGVDTAAFSYGERMKFFPVENLTEAETAHAVVLPARNGVRSYEPAAPDTLRSQGV